MATLFISDLHLDAERPAIIDLFLRFLAEEAKAAAGLYILGDLFEMWIGDDDDSVLGQQVSSALKKLSQGGVSVHVMTGNRDFLLGQRFAATSAAKLLAEAVVIDLYGMPTLIMHGDTLCTDDVAYQRLRAQVRSPQWQAQMLAKSLAERKLAASQLRLVSRQATQQKDPEIMDVNSQAVLDTMEAYGVRRLIHGHTHRSGIHEWIMKGELAQRIVLGDWYSQGNVLYCDAEGCRLQALPLD